MSFQRATIAVATGLVAWVAHFYFAPAFGASLSQPAAPQGTREFTIKDLLSLQDIGGASTGLFFAPDNSAVAFQSREMDVQANEYKLGWWILPLAYAGNPIRVADGGQAITNFLENGWNTGSLADPIARWSPDGKWLSYVRSDRGELQIWRSSRDGSSSEQLTYHDGDVETFVWAPDGGRLFFRAYSSRQEQRATEQRASENGFLWDEHVSIGYSRMPVLPRVSGSEVWTLDVNSGKTWIATGEESQLFGEITRRPALTRRAKARIVLPFNRGRAVSLEALDPDRQGWRAPLTLVVSSAPHGDIAVACPDPACTGQIASVRWGVGAEHLYFIRREGHSEMQTALYEWRPGARKVRTVFRTDDWLGDDCEFLADRAVCLYEGTTQPRQIVAISLHDGTLVPLFDPNLQLHEVKWTQIERLNWQDSYGNDTFAHLVYPSNYREQQTYPLIVVQYRSRGFLRGGVGDEYPIHPYAANGFFVLSWDRPEFREAHARLRDEEATKFDYSEKREYISKLSALEHILQTLSTRGLIDSKRVGITGLSDGAETVDLSLIHSTRFAAAATSQLTDDPIGYYLLSSSDRRLLKAIGLVAPDLGRESVDFWGYISPALNIDKMRTPLLALLSSSEAATAAQAIAAMQDADSPFEAYIYPDSFHIKNRPRHLLRSMERSMDWFNFWLRDVEDLAQEKRDQYRRWRRIRERRTHGLNSASRNQLNGESSTRPLAVGSLAGDEAKLRQLCSSATETCPAWEGETP